MDAGDRIPRQSGIPSAVIFDHFERRPKDRIDTSYREIPPMATAALVSPTNPYHSHHSSFSSGYPHSAPTTSIPSMISPVDSRRTSDDGETGHRQSLPSISEVISGTKSAPYPPPAPAPGPPVQSLPSPFSSSAPPRPFGDVGSEKNPSPRTLHPATDYPRLNTLPAFSDPARPSVSNRPAPPPLNTFSGRHPSPPVKLEQLELERHAEQQYGASHAHGPPPPPPGLYTPTARPPPGQLPFPSFPVSPRNDGASLPSPYESQRPSTLDKHFETWGFGESLHAVAASSRSIFHFADAYIAAAREQQGSQPIPARLPTDAEVNNMISTSIHMVQKLEEIREIVQRNRVNMERARENGARKTAEDEDSPMFGDGTKPYGVTEVKKRRGRAAPPGRCHSCNRVDTPEWRRGPDGARTLCNACGLHYAKLERRRQLDTRQIRPRTSETERS